MTATEFLIDYWRQSGGRSEDILVSGALFDQYKSACRKRAGRAGAENAA